MRVLENLQFEHINERHGIISIRSKKTLEDSHLFSFLISKKKLS